MYAESFRNSKWVFVGDDDENGITEDDSVGATESGGLYECDIAQSLFLSLVCTWLCQSFMLNLKPNCASSAL